MYNVHTECTTGLNAGDFLRNKFNVGAYIV